MKVGFGGSSIFNGSSPSSDEGCVARIVADYVAPFAARPPRVLDIGGTAFGFRRRAALPAGGSVLIANPQQGVGADYAYVADIPGDVPGFDLVMLFGVMMYLRRDPLVALFRDVRQRLRPGGTFLIAEPDPQSVTGAGDMAAKKLVAVLSLGHFMNFAFHTEAETVAMLREAGFTGTASRPELRPYYPGGLLPRQPPYFILAATV